MTKESDSLTGAVARASILLSEFSFISDVDDTLISAKKSTERAKIFPSFYALV